MKKIWIAVLLFTLACMGGGLWAYSRFIGFPRCVSEEKSAYTISEYHVKYDDIDLYGKLLMPQTDSAACPLVIYAHGAESDYKADMTTLKSLAMSGIAVYTFDFYGWSERSTGPLGTSYFKNAEDKNYEEQVFRQVNDLNAVIQQTAGISGTDPDRVYLLGSSMGGATAATCAVLHSDDIRGLILQYPAINLNTQALEDGAEWDVNGYSGPVLILQGTADTIVPLSMSEQLLAHYNKNLNHAEMIVYEGQPHVFTGSCKVQAAADIYRFLQKETDE